MAATKWLFSFVTCPLQNPPALCRIHDEIWSCAGRLDQELVAVTKRVTQMLQMLPRDITPVNLEELRRVKQNLVELESRADTLRQVPQPSPNGSSSRGQWQISDLPPHARRLLHYVAIDFEHIQWDAGV